jgi:hypothetical protein
VAREIQGANTEQGVELDLVIGVGVLVPGDSIGLGLDGGAGWRMLEPDAEDTRYRDGHAVGLLVDPVAPMSERRARGLLRAGVLHLPDEGYADLAAPKGHVEITVLREWVGLVPDLVNNRDERGGHPVPLRRQEGFAQLEFCSEELAGNAKGEEDSDGKDA